ncbi:YveK family protein [Limosilactobacillus reuteri]|uniref:YveK family protein n=1 Tax=Limosilactobacillus reuteri TaxID=1598 RepID=UPI000C1B7C25|nr:Wzz/FepE/Etk N-terminal domain-containing protein [Limosilactobacillus reuteri]PIN29639.1 exopolysaccharide biosynthesis protein [Limosilactobacillus reuteri]PUH32971.1 exopolysaccharide biosynthesis protein [Limosilactobacillus reuteri]PUH33356.1 exopolysaccharide biosynthesis protein [Limosilactobacillus reuteri]WLC95024.1 Wzz/FepE/Etk N-terminal domain-containing protein [Limosilactobacillus reuteri]WRH79028.1 Wzz/FepE/Etk N-terminal domain-containing protein [Limosilactobacillus reuteri
MNNSQQTLNNTIDLHRLMVLCRKHIKMLIIWTLLAGVLGFVIAQFVVVPKYTATTEILVNQKHTNDNNGQAYNNQQADIQMINTYKDIITNQVILSRASKQLKNPVRVIKPAQKAVYRTNADGTRRLIKEAQPAVVERGGKSYNLSTDELKKAISVQTQQNSQVFSLQVKTDDPQESAVVANTVANVFRQQIKKIMSVNNVTIVSRASTPDTPSFPNKKLFALAGAVLGLVLSFLYILIGDLMDTSIHDDEYLTNELGLTNLGHVNHIEMSRDFKINNDNRRHGNGNRRV